MGYSLRMFLASDDGRITTIPAARYGRWVSSKEPLPAELAGQHLRVFEVVVEVERRQIIRVVRVLPYRQSVGADRRLDTRVTAHHLMHAFDDLEGSEEVGRVIDRLEAEANYFWWPTATEIGALAAALFRRTPTREDLTAVEQMVVRPGR